MALHGERREAVADYEGDGAGGRDEGGTVGVVQAAAEVGAQQIGAAVRAGAAHRLAGQAGGGEVGGEGRGVQRRVDGIAGGGVGGLEGEVGLGRLGVAGAAEGDAGGGEAAQAAPEARGVGHARPINAGERLAGMRAGAVSSPMRCCHASNSGAGRRPSTPRTYSASWKLVDW